MCETQCEAEEKIYVAEKIYEIMKESWLIEMSEESNENEEKSKKMKRNEVFREAWRREIRLIETLLINIVMKKKAEIALWRRRKWNGQ